MSIIIKGVSIPKDISRISLTYWSDDFSWHKYESVPISQVIQIPKDHGALIEELEKKLYEYIDPFEVPGALEACYATMEAFYDAMDRFTKGE